MKSLRIAILLCILGQVFSAQAQLKVKAFKKNGYFGLRAQLEEESFLPHLYEQLVVPVYGTIALGEGEDKQELLLPVFLRSAEWIENTSIPNFVPSQNGFYKADTRFMVRARRNARWGLVNWLGKEIVPCAYDSITHTVLYVKDLEREMVLYSLYNKGQMTYATDQGIAPLGSAISYVDWEHPWVFRELKEHRKAAPDTIYHICFLVGRNVKTDTLKRISEEIVMIPQYDSLLGDYNPDLLYEERLLSITELPLLRNGEMNLLDITENKVAFKHWPQQISFPVHLSCSGDEAAQWMLYNYRDSNLLPYYRGSCQEQAYQDLQQQQLMPYFFVTHADGHTELKRELRQRFRLWDQSFRSIAGVKLIITGTGTGGVMEEAWLMRDTRGVVLVNPYQLTTTRLDVTNLDAEKPIYWLERPYYKAVKAGQTGLLQPKTGEWLPAEGYTDLSTEVPTELQTDSMAQEVGPLCLLKNEKGWGIGYLGADQFLSWGMDSVHYFGAWADDYFWLGYLNGKRYLLNRDQLRMDLGESRFLLSFMNEWGYEDEKLSQEIYPFLPEPQFMLFTNAEVKCLSPETQPEWHAGLGYLPMEQVSCKNGTRWQLCNAALEPMHTGTLEDFRLNLLPGQDLGGETPTVQVGPQTDMLSLQAEIYQYRTLPYVLARQGGKWGVLLDGKGWVLSPEFEQLEIAAFDEQGQPLFRCTREGHTAIRNIRGEQVSN